MKNLIFSLIFSTPFVLVSKATPLTPLKTLWTLNENLKNPESVVYEAASKSYFVSNIDGDGMAKDGNGYISQLTLDGKVKKAQWAKGLNAPKGLAVQGNTLWVSDIDELIQFELKSGKQLKKIKVEGAKFLNDVAANTELVFVSDTLANKIFKYDGKNVVAVTSKESLESPNGLLIEGNKLLVASWGEVTDFSQTPKKAGTLYSLSFDGSKKAPTTNSFGSLDGLQKVKGTYIVSDWMTGKLFTVNSKGQPTLISQGAQGYADLEAREVEGKTVVILPLMVENKVVAYEL